MDFTSIWYNISKQAMKISKLLLTIVIILAFLVKGTGVGYALRPMAAGITCLPQIEASLQSFPAGDSAENNTVIIIVPRTAHKERGIHYRPAVALFETCEKIHKVFSEKITIKFSRLEDGDSKEAIYPVEAERFIGGEVMTFMQSIFNLGPKNQLYTGPYKITIEGHFKEYLLREAADILATVLGDERFELGFDLSPLKEEIDERIEQLRLFPTASSRSPTGSNVHADIDSAL